LRTGCPRQRDVTRESFGSVSESGAASPRRSSRATEGKPGIHLSTREIGGSWVPALARSSEDRRAVQPTRPSRVRLTLAVFWIGAAAPAAVALACEASARVRFRAAKVPRPVRNTCRQAFASVWSTRNQELLRPNPGSARLHADSREHSCANKHSAAKSFPHSPKIMHVWRKKRAGRMDRGYGNRARP